VQDLPIPAATPSSNPAPASASSRKRSWWPF
jgi:hypothetical protein